MFPVLYTVSTTPVSSVVLAFPVVADPSVCVVDRAVDEEAPRTRKCVLS